MSTETINIPVGNRLAEIPRQMTEEDFELLIDTLHLWQEKMVIKPVKQDELKDYSI